MAPFRYHLGKYGVDYKKKFVCPSCGHKEFVPYVDSNTGEILPDYGVCDRKNKCGFKVHPTSDPEFKVQKIEEAPPLPRKFVEKATMLATLQYYEHNNFYNFLADLVGDELAMAAFKRYFIGTGKAGSTIYWYINFGRKIVNGKKIIYKTDGHRNKDIHPFYLYKAAEGYGQCLYGEHLLSIDPKKPVGIVEAEKSAVFGSIFDPEFTWLACGGSNGLTDEKIKCLQGRDVKIFPDCDDAGREMFQKRAPEIAKIAASVKVCDLDKSLNNGEDYADIMKAKMIEYKKQQDGKENS